MTGKIDRRRVLGPRCKPVRIYGMLFPSISCAARSVGADVKYLSHRLRQGKPLGTNLRRRFEDLRAERERTAA